ncbi:hypothetical protein ACMTAS_1438 [Thermotoga neapolitana DSM 4359]
MIGPAHENKKIMRASPDRSTGRTLLKYTIIPSLFKSADHSTGGDQKRIK